MMRTDIFKGDDIIQLGVTFPLPQQIHNAAADLPPKIFMLDT